jgi:hypothetical protein
MTATESHLEEQHANLKSSPVADRFQIAWANLGAECDGLAPARVILSERMLKEMQDSAVPLDLRALRAVQPSPLATDIYAWTTYRAFRLPSTHATSIPWSALRLQFGSTYFCESDFKAAFRNALNQVQMVYPMLKCEVTPTHFTMWRSPPSVPAATSRRARAA